MKQLIKRKTQRGSMVIVAIFIIVVMLALGLALTRVLQSSANANAVEFYGARAILAARSGLEITLAELFAATTSQCSEITSFQGTGETFTANGLQNCNVTVTCNQVLNASNTASPLVQNSVFRLDSVAECTPDNRTDDPWRTTRAITVEVKTLN